MVKRQSVKRSVDWSIGDGQAQYGLRAPKAYEQQLIYPQQTFKSRILSKLVEVSPCAQFVDIGVNIGQALVEVFSLYPEFEYHGFEPSVEALCCAKEVAIANGFLLSFYPWACASEAEPQNFFAESNVDSSATIISAIRPDTYINIPAQPVAAFPLDQVFSIKPSMAFL